MILPQRRGPSLLARLAVLLIAALAALTGVGWYYAGQILGPDPPEPLAEQRLIDATDSTMTLEPDPDARAAGIAAVEWPGGYGELGDHLRDEPNAITRRFRVQFGEVPSVPRVSARPYAMAADPYWVLGIPFHDVMVHNPEFPCPAWRIDPTDSIRALARLEGRTMADSSWMIFVHGRGANRAQSLGLAPVFLRLGWTVFAISYRGDVGDPRHGYRMGATEWRDLESAVRYALDHGAARVVVAGTSMGGSIALEFLRHSSLAPRVAGVVLEAPVLRWRPVFDVAARERNVPPSITGLGMALAAVRGGIDWSDLDQIAHASEFHTPMLVLHGTADTQVPPALSELLAARRSDLVTLVRVLGAGHARCHNVDPRGVDAAVASWLGHRI